MKNLLVHLLRTSQTTQRTVSIGEVGEWGSSEYLMIPRLVKKGEFSAYFFTFF
ncbi:MAG TPA: hypothetical protein PK299_03960 [Anaerolineales bacterium]|nr:hypothetical protein [Anaerolineales bacterium]